MTASGQMYLQTIYMLALGKKKVRVVDIANTLSVSKASVCGALCRLTREGYVIHERYGDVALTEIGWSESEKLIARWRPGVMAGAVL